MKRNDVQAFRRHDGEMNDIDTSLEELLAQPESKTLDFRRDLSSPKSITRNLVAFANTSGGTIGIGVDDDKAVRGVSDLLKDEEKLASLINDTVRPALLPDIELYALDGKHIMIVRIARALGPFFLMDSACASTRTKIRRLLEKYDYPPDYEDMAIDLVLEHAELFAISRMECSP